MANRSFNQRNVDSKCGLGIETLDLSWNVQTPRDVYTTAADVRGACAPFCERRLYRPIGRNAAASRVRGACTSFRKLRLYHPRRTLTYRAKHVAA